MGAKEQQAYRLDVPSLIFSLLIIRPKPAFISWLQALGARRAERTGDTTSEIYDPVEDRVWIIPKLGTYKNDLEQYLEALKPLLLERQLADFGPDSGDLPVLDADSFDRFFEIELRSEAALAPTAPGFIRK